MLGTANSSMTIWCFAGSVSTLLAGGDRLPNAGLRNKRKVESSQAKQPAHVHRVAENNRKLALHNLIRPVQTQTEIVLFVHLLPDLTRGTKTDYWSMAI